MNGYGRAWVKRVAHGQAVADARELLGAPSCDVARTWADGCCSLVPGRQDAIEQIAPAEWVAVGVWVASTTKLDWLRAEWFWRLLSTCRQRLVFELSGNQAQIRLTLRCHRDDAAHVQESFTAVYPDCATNEADDHWWRTGAFSSYAEVDCGWSPSRMTMPDGLPDSVLWAAVEWLLSISGEAVGFYQCVLEPATLTDAWHREIEAHHDLGFLARLFSPQGTFQRPAQQIPSGDLRTRAEELAKKANPDLPFFGVALRCGIVGEEKRVRLSPQFFSAFRIDGNALMLRSVPAPSENLRSAFFRAGASFRTGLLFNSAELAVLAHVMPHREQVAKRTSWFLYREDVSAAQSAKTGTHIGDATMFGRKVSVCITPDIRDRSTQITSTPGNGKSELMMTMFIQDVAAGNGGVFIDAHGDSLTRLMEHLSPHLRDRIIYFNPADKHWTPVWNLLAVPSGGDLYLVAGNLLSAIQRISQGWGDRLAIVLRHAFVGLLHVPNSTMHDVFNVTRQGSSESEALRKKIIAACPDVIVRKFWENDFLTSYTEKELAAPRHKLIHIISGGAVSAMFAQTESRIDVRAIMDSGKILLVDLSRVSDEAREFLGSFLLMLFAQAATGRSDQRPSERKPFSIFADEAHLYVAGNGFETILAQARKFRVNLVLAHQNLRQFAPEQIDALSNAGTKIVGRVNYGDAAFFAKNFQGKIAADEIAQLDKYEFVAQIGTEIVRFKSLELTGRTDPTAVSTIIEQSHSRYYASAKAAKPSRQAFGVGTDWSAYASADLGYEEWK